MFCSHNAITVFLSDETMILVANLRLLIKPNLHLDWPRTPVNKSFEKKKKSFNNTRFNLKTAKKAKITTSNPVSPLFHVNLYEAEAATKNGDEDKANPRQA
ncbi:hypothetical protein KFK09_027970 [Dendrobium nobile]|uniref:Uncharacterized protein n=1 Tax=Dendrobium nobile TaxID=94219 RepID=A0A8T3A635_DENNO|nr:hypothetical protein KFK09_027970 [Dendrobium nobile]